MTDRPEVLVLKPIYQPAMAALERDYIVHKLWTADDAERYMLSRCGNVRALITSTATGFTRSDLDALPNVEIVACMGAGRDSFDMDAANARGIPVAVTPDSIAYAVADLALTLMLAVMRRICEADRFVRAGKWLDTAPPAGRDVAGKTCGIIGLGQIGLGVARRAEAFGMSICYHGPRKKDAPYRYYDDLEAMARACDCLVVACPLTPQTRDLVSARVIDAMKPGAFVVNVARGPIVNEAALIAALQDKRLGGAGLDVYWDEPRVPPALIAMDNVVLAPHVGSSTYEIREERSRKFLANLSAHFSGQPVPYLFRAK